MLKIIAGGAVAALMVMAAPQTGAAAETGKAPGARQSTEQATDFSSRHRRWHGYRYVRPYYRPYAYRPYYSPYYGYPAYGGYYGYPYRRGPAFSFGFGF